MREDLESELRGCLKRCRRMIAAGGSAHLRNAADLRRNIDALREELRCRAMLSLPAVDSLKE
jgi:hypothetical protein